MIHYNESWCQIHHLEDLNCILLNWTGYARSEQFQDACNASLDLLHEKKATKMIADNRKGKVISKSDVEWMNTEWFPKAYLYGYRASAVIMSLDLFNEVAVKRIVNDMDQGKFYVQFFKELEPAKEWLRTLEIEN